ncbi:AAA family ATPase [Deinococcus radiotolerans]|uniref:ORC1/DEAH AAA+ ATPase domain-containing protein n=1 Tax=Deinococcus radiotolerans TaxID=1309407 RepID=A0ABQ2FQU8_9DEIO|nr:AAA family ATPase [Deinococcus radiotolerans]GGL17610.1 hypothetical protein GCM10010844_40550 [Deinococcus radiotolerans]
MPALFRSLDPLPSPRLQDVPRTRLLAAIHAARDANVVVLHGGAGFGKTTLLAQWAQAEAQREAFSALAALSLTDEQADATGFIRALLKAVQDAEAHVSLDAARGALAQQSPLRAAGLLAETLNDLPGSLLLLLDGAQHLSTPAQQCLERFIQVLAEGHQVGLSVYDPSAVPFLTALTARGAVMAFGPSELAFTEEETRRALPWLAPGEPLPLPHDELEGWPIAVGLLRSGPATAGSLDALARWALDRLPPDVRVTVQDMSVWSEWGEAEARELDVPPVATWLEDVTRAGLPVAVQQDGQARPHGLLRRQLKAELALRPERAARCWQRAAATYERQGQLLEALRAAQAGGAAGEALRLAERVTAQHWPRREFWLAREILEGFAVHTLPVLLQQRLAVAQLETGRAAQGAALLQALSEATDLAACSWLALAEHAWRQGDMTVLRTYLDAAARVASTAAEQVQLERFEVRALIRLGRFDVALPRVEALVQRAEALGEPYELGACLSLRGIVLFSLGRTADGVRALQQELAFYDIQHTPYSGIPARMNLALCFAFQGQFDDALREARRAAQDAHASFSRSAARTWITLILVHLMRREYAAAHDEVQRALGSLDLRTLAPQERTDLWVHALECAARTGDAALRAQAERTLDACLLEFPQARAPQWAFVHRAVAFTQARLHLLRPPGQDEATWRELAGALTEMLRQPIPYGPPAMHELHVRLFLAEAQRRAGLPWEENVKAMGPLVPLPLVTGLLRTTEPDLPGVFSHLRQEAWWPAHLPAPVAERAQGPTRPHLRVRSLGRVEVTLDGQAVQFPFAKCEELLMWLALHGPSSRAQIINALWDGSNNPAHAEYFRLIVRRLRTALTQAGAAHLNPVPYTHGLYSLHEDLDVWVDVRAALEGTGSEEQGRDAALAGVFLPRHASEWVQAVRARLVDAALSSLHQQAEEVESHAPDRARQLYQRMLVFDPLSEAAHAGVLRCCEALGDQVGMQAALRARKRALFSSAANGLS